MAVYATTPRYTAALGIVLGTWCLVGGCSWIPKGDSQFDVGIKDRGTASWYGEPFHGRQAADGTIYDMERLTAAHRTMPLGSMVRVINLANGKYIYVRITDRGPYINGRVIDLSHAAAVRLDMEKGGLSLVQVEIVGERRPDALLSSDAAAALSLARIVRADSTMQPEGVALGAPRRPRPGDLWTRRRDLRVPATLAADHTAHVELAGLVLD
jgi:rare lipoprotein A